MITSVYQLSALVPKKQKAITDSIFDDLLVMAMAKSFVRNVLEIVWLVGEGRMAENKRGGNKKVWNREEQVWGGVESMQQRGPTSRCVVHFGFVCSLVWCGCVVHFGFVWMKPPRARRWNHPSHFFKTLLSKLDHKGARRLITYICYLMFLLFQHKQYKHTSIICLWSVHVKNENWTISKHIALPSPGPMTWKDIKVHHIPMFSNVWSGSLTHAMVSVGESN